MKAAVQRAGVLIPKRLLKGATAVEIRRERGRVVVLPLRASQDPIRKLGRRPVRCELFSDNEICGVPAPPHRRSCPLFALPRDGEWSPTGK